MWSTHHYVHNQLIKTFQLRIHENICEIVMSYFFSFYFLNITNFVGRFAGRVRYMFIRLFKQICYGIIRNLIRKRSAVYARNNRGTKQINNSQNESIFIYKQEKTIKKVFRRCFQVLPNLVLPYRHSTIDLSMATRHVSYMMGRVTRKFYKITEIRVLFFFLSKFSKENMSRAPNFDQVILSFFC